MVAIATRATVRLSPQSAAQPVSPVAGTVRLASASAVLPEHASLRICDAGSASSLLELEDVQAPCRTHVPSLTRYGRNGAILRETVTLAADSGVSWADEAEEVGVELRVARPGIARLKMTRANGSALLWEPGDGPSAAALAVLDRLGEVYGENDTLNALRAAARRLEPGEIRWIERDGTPVALLEDEGLLVEASISQYDEGLTLEVPLYRNEESTYQDLNGDGRIGGQLGGDDPTARMLVSERIRTRVLAQQQLPEVEELLARLQDFPDTFGFYSHAIRVPFEANVVLEDGQPRIVAAGEATLPIVAIQYSRYGNDDARLVTPTGQSLRLPLFDHAIAGVTREVLAGLDPNQHWFANDWQRELDALARTPTEPELDYYRATLPLDGAALAERLPGIASDALRDATWLRLRDDGSAWSVGGPPGFTYALSNEEVAALIEELEDTLLDVLPAHWAIRRRLELAEVVPTLRRAYETGEPVLEGSRIFVGTAGDGWGARSVVAYDLEEGTRTTYRFWTDDPFSQALPQVDVYAETPPKVELAYAMRTHLDALVDRDGNATELDAGLWASFVDGLPELAATEPEDPVAATTWRAFNYDQAAFEEMSELLSVRHGSRPRRWLGYMNDSRERPVMEAVVGAAEQFDDLDPSFLYVVAIGEGMNRLIDRNYNGENGAFEVDYISGFNSLGTDVFGMDVDLLRARGLLPEPFEEGVHYTLSHHTNEKGEDVVAANFHSVPDGPTALQNGLSALSAMLINTERGLLRYARNRGHDVESWTDSERHYVSYVGYNAGYGTARDYIDSLAPGESPLRPWVGDDQGGSSMRVHYNTALRISTWEMLKSLGVWDRVEESRFDVRELYEADQENPA